MLASRHRRFAVCMMSFAQRRKTMTANTLAYENLIKHTKEMAALGSTISLLHWDQEVKMPPKGIEYRADQIAFTSKLLHELKTNPKVNDWIQACEEDNDLMSDPLKSEFVNVRELRRSYDRSTKLPASLVEEEAMLASRGQSAWAEARKNNDRYKDQQ